MRVLVNLDAGEHDDEPPELWQLVDLVAIACGGHAGDEQAMARVIAACATQQLAAHPSYPDRDGFVQSGISKLRYATLMGIKKAKTKEIRASPRPMGASARRSQHPAGSGLSSRARQADPAFRGHSGGGRRQTGGEIEIRGAGHMSILVVMEQRAGEWNRMSFETLAAAQQLAGELSTHRFRGGSGAGRRPAGRGTGRRNSSTRSMLWCMSCCRTTRRTPGQCAPPAHRRG